ncbi:hypothetical protein ABOM_004035 [Aspergillus bombycis]|uniref:Major facilitator superfamily (MFS) profile domain-containing protein n=1 Tax=Aspergillus bombycis TaxID=109264 RepID=A0A1F8ACY5_9EURO|nr:hypothetical protein ABOM_004035 [Aspergillus bombycis]OGM49208.1 hypothetical protein ABOM_004035 [Aspergillus bombycis]
MSETVAVEKDLASHIETIPGNNEAVSSNENSTLKELWQNRRVLLWCLLIFLLPVNFGYENAMIGNLFASRAFQLRFGVEVNGSWAVAARDQQILNAAPTIGLFASALATGYLSDFLGRKKVVILACIICVGGVILQYFSETVMMLFGGKLVACFGFGLGHSLGPVWVAELAPNSIRGICLALINTMIVIGQWLSSLCIYAASFRDNDLAWRIPLITQIIMPGLLFIIGVPLLPESPTWLLMRGRDEEAHKALKRFNGPRFDADSALQIMRNALEMEKSVTEAQSSASYLDCFRGPNLRRTTIICMVYLAQQFLGVNFVSGYLTYYFDLAGVGNALAVAQGAYAIQLFGNMCSWPLIERIGRRSMLVYGSTIMTVGLLVIGCVNIRITDASLKATVALMCLWGWLYQGSLGAVAYAVGGETPTPRLRQKTYAINIMSATAVSCMVNQVIPYLINPDKANLGGKIGFIFFGPSVLVCIYLFFCVPEMQGRTPEELEEMFTVGVPARKFQTYVCQGQRLEERKEDLA